MQLNVPRHLSVNGNHSRGFYAMADAPTNPRGPALELDRHLPIPNISRIMKKALPANAKIAKDAKVAVQECISEFIAFITSEASDKCLSEKRKTMNGDDLLWAMATLGYEDYLDPLKLYLARYRELEGDTKGSVRSGAGSGRPDQVGLTGQNAQGPLPNWLELPTDVTAKILHKLGAFEILARARLVCPLWWKICKDPLIWRTIDLTNRFRYPVSALDKFSRLAIELSCGHLEDIRIVYADTDDEVLKCVADSGSRLRKMRLVKCYGISDKGLSEAVKKFPLLEELEISLNDLSKDTAELIGQSCPFLKLVKLELFGNILKGSVCNDVAFAIAKTMPELRHLELFRNTLNNEGLQAILDGCPHLEYLDLHGCYNVDSRGSLRERCRKQIKDSYFPLDFTFPDYEEDDEDWDEEDDEDDEDWDYCYGLL